MSKKKSSVKKPIVEVSKTPVPVGEDTQFEVVPKEEAVQTEVGKPEEIQPEVVQLEIVQLEPAKIEESIEKPELIDQPNPQPKPKPLTMASLRLEIDELRNIIQSQSQQIADLMSGPVLKRKPMTSNGKVQIKDKTTGRVFPSKNNTYQTLLKGGTLKDLVDKGIFGDVPSKNSFGWYALNRAFPGRFEEITPDTIQTINKNQKESDNNENQ